ncbi:MAG: hypothetical protein WC449_05320 [Candidatus Paceibacterota bacterium]
MSKQITLNFCKKYDCKFHTATFDAEPTGCTKRLTGVEPRISYGVVLEEANKATLVAICLAYHKE